MQGSVSISPIYGVPDINVGDDLAIIIGDCLEKSFNEVIDGDSFALRIKFFLRLREIFMI